MSNNPKPARRSLRNMWIAGAMLASLCATAVVSVNAWAESQQTRAVVGERGHFQRGMEGESGFFGGPMAGRHLARLLDEVGATDAQRGQIRQIVDQAQTDLKALREKGRALREGDLDLWAQPQIDPAAIESHRQAELAQHDQVSKRVTQVMLDVAKVLTPEQRTKLVAELKARHARMAEHRGPAMKAKGAVAEPQKN
jgi:Spy/CpxP family protein refolding chaperone